MCTARSIGSIGAGTSGSIPVPAGPIPVPELERRVSDRGLYFRTPHIIRAIGLALLVILGVTASGVAASKVVTPGSVATGHHSASSKSQSSKTHSSAAVSLGQAKPLAAPTTSTSPSNSLNVAASSAASPPSTSVPAPTPTTTSTPPPSPANSIIQASGPQLYLYGSPYRFVGVNAYEVATEWGMNAGCGTELSDVQLNQLFASLPPNSLVRFWAFQGTIGTNYYTHQLDWRPLDRVFGAAAAHGQRLIVVIGGQGSGCDSLHWQDPSWYDGGVRDVFNDPATTDGRGLTPLPYWTYLQDIVSRYATSPALGMWEPMSEAEASTCPAQFQPTNCSGHQTCPNEPSAAAALRYFFDTVGAEVHSLDPKHLVESGLLGGGQCGTQGTDYQFVSASSGIDVLSYHDYGGATPMGGDQWNGIAERLRQSTALGKPIIAGEAGLIAGTAPGCMSNATRNADLIAKEQAQIQAGSSGLLLWNWVPSLTVACSFDVSPADPLMQVGGATG